MIRREDVRAALLAASARDDAGLEDATVSMSTDTSAASDAPEDDAPAPDEVPGSEDATVAMRIVQRPDDAKTTALPIQLPPDNNATQRMRTTKPPTDRVVPPRSAPLSKPPSTPRSAPGPKQPVPQGPSGPPPAGAIPETEQTRPSPPRQVRPPVASAPSPADIHATRPAQTMNGPAARPRPPQPRPIAAPQRITPNQTGATATVSAPPAALRSKRVLLLVGGAAVLVIALIVVAVSLIGSGGGSAEDKVRAVITDYTDGLKAGDLAALRDSTCGQLHDFYQGITEEQFANVHRQSMDNKAVPVVDSVDAIRITDNTALAQATVYTEADPTKRTARTFDLEKTDTGWKICDPSQTLP